MASPLEGELDCTQGLLLGFSTRYGRRLFRREQLAGERGIGRNGFHLPRLGSLRLHVGTLLVQFCVERGLCFLSLPHGLGNRFFLLALLVGGDLVNRARIGQDL